MSTAQLKANPKIDTLQSLYLSGFARLLEKIAILL